ncbi:MAG: hemerythrin domain-containing protein [Pseudolabrys sp.]|jgi:hemerythrin superfamily protein
MQNIGNAFAHDHRRLEQALETSVAHVRAGRWDAAADAFGTFRRGIERHMAVEEEVLFPAVEEGAETPLTAILRKGHRDLSVFFDELGDAVDARDAVEYDRIADSMRALLDRHDEKEEAELYPAAQARLGTPAAAAGPGD